MVNLIFDADDTLWVTQPIYEAARGHFATLLEQEGLGIEWRLRSSPE